MQFHAHRFRFMDLMETGNIAAARVAQAACARLAATLRQSYYLWYGRSFEALQAFLDSRFEDCERAVHAAAAIGQRALNQNVTQIFAMQLFALRREQGRLGELEAPVRAFVAQYPTLPAWRAALAVICAELGDERGARDAFAWLAADAFAKLPRDTFWLAAVAGLADVCVFLQDTEHAAVLYGLLTPYADRTVMMTPGTACSGVAARPLGRLAAQLDQWTAAVLHFETAVKLHQRLGARHFVAHTQVHYAEALLAREQPGDVRRARKLLAQALATYDDLRMPYYAVKARALDRPRGKQAVLPRTRPIPLRPR
jgi:tetratricopeptide (TPR) repeat protein